MGRSSGAMPGPVFWMTTVVLSMPSVTRKEMVPPSSVNFTAFSMRLYTTWWSRSWSPHTCRGPRSSRPWISSRRSSMRCSKVSRAVTMVWVMSNSAGWIFISPLSMRDRSSMDFTSRDRRLTSLETTSRYFFCSPWGMVPSKIPSMNPAMVVMGVFSSWETLAIKLRRIPSEFVSEFAMLLKERASCPNSSVLVTGTRTEKSPAPKDRAAADICRRGRTIR